MWRAKDSYWMPRHPVRNRHGARSCESGNVSAKRILGAFSIPQYVNCTVRRFVLIDEPSTKFLCGCWNSHKNGGCVFYLIRFYLIRLHYSKTERDEVSYFYPLWSKHSFPVSLLISPCVPIPELLSHFAILHCSLHCMMDDSPDDQDISDNLATPKALRGTAEQRRSYLAGVRSLGLIDDAEEKDAIEKENQIRSAANSPDPSSGKPFVKAEDQMEVTGDTNDRKEIEFAEDEYFPHMGALDVEAPEEFGVPMPRRVPTYAERQQEIRKKPERFTIVSLILENFKSYANRVAIGPFHKNFTCIVGPNGSGKSNTIDALLFVFGYKSKRLRAAKFSELIHKSDKFPDFTFCRVTARFAYVIPDPEDKYAQTVIPGSEYEVTRTAHKDNRTSYTVKKGGKEQERTAKDVHALLLKDGIDLDQNRFLILQGEVEQIALMKPKGKNDKDEEMLEFVEEVIGTKQYIEPIKIMEAKVEQLAKEEEIQNMKVHEFGKQMNSLEAVKNETERFLMTENEVIFRQHKLLQLDRARLVAKRETALETLKEAQAELDSRENGLKERKEQREEVEELYENKKKYIRDMEKGDSVEERNYKAVEAQRTRLQTKFKTVKENIPKLTTATQKLQDQLEEQQDAPERLRTEIVALEEIVRTSNEKLEQLEATIHQKTEELPTLIGNRHERIQELEKKLASCRPALQASRKQVDDKEVEYRGFNIKYDRAVEHRRELEGRLETLKIDNASQKQKLDRLRQEYPEKKDELARIRPDVERLRRELEDTTQKIRRKRDEIDAAAARSQIQTNDRLLKRLLEAQRDGQLEGVIGRLGDLATIDAKYDVAVSTNFGRLDNILVRDVAASTAVIEFLKRHNLGRTNLLVLERLADCVRNNIDKRFNTPKDSERLFDLITPAKPEYRPAFYYVFRDCLVSDTLETATSIAYGAHKQRVVTLDGKQVDGVSGSMSGGGDAYRGKMRTNAQGFVLEAYRGPPVEEMEAECAVWNQQATNIQQQLTELTVQLAELEPEVARQGQVLKALENELAPNNPHSSARLIAQLEENIARQEQVIAEAKPDPVKDAEFKIAIESLKKALTAEEAKSETFENSLKEINGEITAITDKHVNKFRQELTKEKSALAKRDKELLSRRNELQNHDMLVKKLEKDIKKKETELQEKQADLRNMEVEADALEEQWNTLHKEVIKKKEELKADKAEEKTLLDKIRVLDGQIEELETRVAESSQVVNKSRSDSESCLKHCAHIEKEMKGLKLNTVHSEDPRAKMKLVEYTQEELDTFADLVDVMKQEIVSFKTLMNTMDPKQNVLDEYYKLSDSRESVMKGVEDVRRRRKLGFSYFVELKNRRYSEFNSALRIIQGILKTTYRQLTLGGDASLEPVDRFDPFSSGLEFMVKPKTKSWKNISYLSGGEKTISSLALIFSLHYFKPTPFYIMDEIDAALDYRNTSVIAFFVKERAVAAQFIIVSLRNQMFETAYRLIGICKPDHQSRSMYIDPPKLVISQEEDGTATGTVDPNRQTGSAFSQATQAPAALSEDGSRRPTMRKTGSVFSQATNHPDAIAEDEDTNGY